jgi:hypothetical protein
VPPVYRVYVNSNQLFEPDVLKISISRQRSDIFNRLSVGAAQIELMAESGLYVIRAGTNTTTLYTRASQQIFTRAPSLLNTRIAKPDGLAINQNVVIQAAEGSSLYTIFTGFVESFDFDAALNAGRRINLKCGDIASRLQNPIQTSFQYLVSQETVFRDILQTAGISSSQYVLDSFPDAIVFSYADQLTAGEALAVEQQAGAHYIYVDGAGRINIKNRNYDNVSATAVASFASLYGMKMSVSDAEVVNECKVKILPRRILFDIASVAALADPVFVTGNGSASVTVEYIDSTTQESGAPVYSLAPIVAGDYFISSSPDVTGADLSSQCLLTITPFARSANVTLVNSGTQNAFLASLTLYGSPASRYPEVQVSVPSSASQVTYRKRLQEIQADSLQTSARGRNLAEYVIFRYADPIPEIEIQIKNQWPFVVSAELGNHVWLSNSLLNVSSSFHIDEVEHTIDFSAGIEHTLSARMKLIPIKGWFTLDSSTLGRLDINRLGF